MAAPDKQIFDLTTVIDNLLAQISSQNQVQIQQNNQIIGALNRLEAKPTILQAPQLTTINLEPTIPDIPENVDISPQFYYDLDNDRYYKKTSSFILASYSEDILAGGTEGLGSNKLKDLFTFVESQIGLRAEPFDLARIVMLQRTSFNPETGNIPGDVIRQIFKNNKQIIYLNAPPNISAPILTDRSDQDFYFLPDDTINEVTTNNSANTVNVFHLTFYWLYRLITKDSFIDYMSRIRNAFT
jgi:hypothetical protein